MDTRGELFECNVDAQAREIGKENCDGNILGGLIAVSRVGALCGNSGCT